MAPTSYATPSIERASERFGVSPSSNTVSRRPNIASASVPTSASAGRTKIPSEYALGTSFPSIPSSCKEQIIPFDS